MTVPIPMMPLVAFGLLAIALVYTGWSTRKRIQRPELPRRDPPA